MFKYRVTCIPCSTHVVSTTGTFWFLGREAAFGGGEGAAHAAGGEAARQRGVLVGAPARFGVITMEKVIYPVQMFFMSTII